MTPSEVAYLVLVVGALSAFAGVLGFISWYARPRRSSTAQRTVVLTPSLGATRHAAAR